MSVIHILMVTGHSILQLLLVILLAPLVEGTIEVTKSFLTSRKGPSILQPYWDLTKYLRKQDLKKLQQDDIFWKVTARLIVMGLCVLLVPTFIAAAPLESAGDVIVLGSLLHLEQLLFTSKLHPVSIALQTAMLLSWLAVCIHVGTLSLGSAVSILHVQGAGLLEPYWFLSLAIMIFLTGLATGRIPTVLHVVQAPEFASGWIQGCFKWSQWIRQMLLFTILVNLFFPFGLSNGQSVWSGSLALFIYLLKMGLVSVAAAVTDILCPQIRTDRLQRFLYVSVLIGLLAMVSNFYVSH